MVGDLLVSEEEDLARLWHVWWDPAAGAFQKRLVAEAGHWEHVTFAPAALPPLLPLPQAHCSSELSIGFRAGSSPRFLVR